MDTITHGILGGLIGKAFFGGNTTGLASWREPPKTAGRIAIWAATLGAVFPDVDTLAGPLAGNSLAIMTWHRGITHSIILLPVWAASLAFLTQWLSSRLRWACPKWPTLFLIYALGLGSHIFLDLITSFGTMIWSPIDYARFAWDWLFIIDLSLTSLAIAPQLAAWAFEHPEVATIRAVSLYAVFSIAGFALIPITHKLNVPYSDAAALAVSMVLAFLFLLPLRVPVFRLSRTGYSRTGIVLVALYISFAGMMHHAALRRIVNFASESRIAPDAIAALPLPPSPARWAGMIATSDAIYRMELNEFSGRAGEIQYFQQAKPNQYIAAADALRDVQIFNWFARFPLVRYSDAAGQPVVSITSMSFYRGQDQGSGSNPPEMTNFTYRVVFSRESRVLSHGWVRPE